MATPPEHTRNNSLQLWLWAGAALLIAALTTTGWLIQNAKVTSVDARLESEVAVVRSPLSDSVDAVLVQKGDSVASGKAIARLRGTTLLDLAAEFGHVRGQYGDSQSQTLRLRWVLARHEEECLLSRLHDSVATHARAQLALRSAQARGLTPSSAQLDAENHALQVMETIRREHEHASHVRAMLGKELEQWQAHKGVSHQGTTSADAASVMDMLQDMLLVSAPLAGTITAVHVAPGDTVVRGDRILEILPKQEGPSVIRAWMPAEQANSLRVGLFCRISAPGMAPAVGRITHILPSIMREIVTTQLRGQELRAKIGSSTRLLLPVLISAVLPVPILPDIELSCEVYTLSWPWLEPYLKYLP